MKKVLLLVLLSLLLASCSDPSVRFDKYGPYRVVAVAEVLTAQSPMGYPSVRLEARQYGGGLVRPALVTRSFNGDTAISAALHVELLPGGYDFGDPADLSHITVDDYRTYFGYEYPRDFYTSRRSLRFTLEGCLDPVEQERDWSLCGDIATLTVRE